jgi:Second Messenger Oligonucleotide or Dinucleotide Synthetase domain
MSSLPLNLNLDELLLDVATIIEPSNADRKIIDRRYRSLKTHLERPASQLSKYLKEDESRIYSQGSVSVSSVIISGDEDDRFDVDAIVEFETPQDWSSKKPLDVLYEALQGFPSAESIVRNTRCVTVNFAFMHLDVTIMDPHTEPRYERVGSIFHSPDKGDSYRVTSNPFGFATWFRSSVFFQQGVGSFAERIAKRRVESFVDRLTEADKKAADQDALPPMLPPRFDAQQVVALKLMKRYLNLRYSSLEVRKPPSIYITKKAADCGFEPMGLTEQLIRLAESVRSQMDLSLSVARGPDERNPECFEDRLNDRWPETQEDRFTLHASMINLIAGIESAKKSSFADIVTWISKTFGERVTSRSVENHLSRRGAEKNASVMKGTGMIIPSTVAASPIVSNLSSPIPRHNFHNGKLEIES